MRVYDLIQELTQYDAYAEVDFYYYINNNKNDIGFVDDIDIKSEYHFVGSKMEEKICVYLRLNDM